MADSESKKSIAHEIALWLAELRAHWFQPIEAPLAWWRRFGYACAGSLTWLMGIWLSERSPISSERLPTELANINPQLWVSQFVPSVLIVVSIAAPVFFAWLVAWRERSVGPISLYIQGFLLPVFVSWILFRMWAAGLPKEVVSS